MILNFVPGISTILVYLFFSLTSAMWFSAGSSVLWRPSPAWLQGRVTLSLLHVIESLLLTSLLSLIPLYNCPQSLNRYTHSLSLTHMCVSSGRFVHSTLSIWPCLSSSLSCLSLSDLFSILSPSTPAQLYLFLPNPSSFLPF